MTRAHLVASVVISFFASAASPPQGPPRPALQWSLAVAKEYAQTSLTSEPDVRVLLGPLEDLRLEIGVGNAGGPPVDISSVLDLVQVSLMRNGVVVPLAIQRTPSSPHHDSPYLHDHEGFGMSFTIQRDDRLAFDEASYLLSVGFAAVVSSLKTMDGQPWQGQVRTVVQRRLDIRKPRDRYELRAFWRIEGNDYLRKRRPYDAIRLLEPLAREEPDDWQAHMALGAAYLQTKQYEPAVAVLARALPHWQKFPERRGDVVPNLLARAYLGLGRNLDATRVLRNTGVPENEIATRLRALAQANQ